MITGKFITVCSICGIYAALLGGCGSQTNEVKEPVDAVSSPSVTHYEENSLSKEELLEAIKNEQGGCTIATVNPDGTPDLIIAVPGVADNDHIIFGWADNSTKSNVLRTKEAMISYYIFDNEESDKQARYSGGRMKVVLEEDQDVLKKLLEDNPDLPSIGTILRITEVLPLG